MTSYYNQHKPNAPTGDSSLLDNSKSYNSILNELHDCVLTKPFMDKAIQPYHIHRAPLPIAPSLSTSNKQTAKPSPKVLPIAPALSLHTTPVSNTFFPIAPTLSDTSGLFAAQPSPHNEKSKSPTCGKNKVAVEEENKEKGQEKGQETEKEEDELLIPTHKDTLFWCFYIIKYGVQAYFTIGNRQFIVEKQEKISAIELLREKKELLKQHKIKPFTSIEEDLSHNPTISVKTFFALLIANDLGATYLHKDTFVEVNTGCTNQEPHIVQYVRPNVYAYLQDPTQHTRITRIANKVPWNSIDKPVLAMTSYKSDELLELFGKLRIVSSIPSDKKPTKKEIYDAVIAYFL